MIADTSLAAYHGLQAMAALEKLEKQILEFLAAHPDEAFTRDQISAATGLKLSSVCGRVNKLLDPLKCQDRIWIEELPAQRQASGRSAHPVRIYRPVGQLSLSGLWVRGAIATINSADVRV